MSVTELAVPPVEDRWDNHSLVRGRRGLFPPHRSQQRHIKNQGLKPLSLKLVKEDLTKGRGHGISCKWTKKPPPHWKSSVWHEEGEEDEGPLPGSVSSKSSPSASVPQFSWPSWQSKLCVVLGTVVGAVVVAPKVVMKNVGPSGVVGGAGLVRSGMWRIKVKQRTDLLQPQLQTLKDPLSWKLGFRCF